MTSRANRTMTAAGLDLGGLMSPDIADSARIILVTPKFLPFSKPSFRTQEDNG